MRIGYRREDKRIGMAKQLVSLNAAQCEKIYDEDKGDGFAKRDWIIDRKVRLGTKDEIAVARLFLLDTRTKGLREAIERAHARNAVIIETDTGRRSDRTSDLLAMFEDASLAYAGRWLSPERAAEIGKDGAAASPASKKRSGFMPPGEARKILNDHIRYPTLAQALAVINRDKRFKEPWSRARVYRMWDEMKLIARSKGRAAKWNERS
jgi:hypothetical protein